MKQPLGKRVGTKKSDTRWQSPDGTIWASRFEYSVYAALKGQRVKVRKCSEQDRMAYESAVRLGACARCGSSDVFTRHHYTPDLHVVPKGKVSAERGGYYIEAKGYIRAPRRTLLRSFRKAQPSVDLRMVFQRDYAISKTMTIVQWARKYLKCPVHVWNGTLPDDWK